nr:hypothetical protein [Candidatus Sigynarchaeota archaeon]
MKHALIKILLVTSFIAFAGLLVQREFSVIFSRGAIPRRHDSSFETRPVTKPVVSATNDHRPTLTSGTVTPSTGNTNSTMFMFSVVYTDRDNNPATFVNVTLNWWVWAMHKVDTSDSNYVDGCTYMYSTMLNAAWNYSFSFSCSDGTFTDSASATSGPSVRMPIIPWNMTWNDGRNNYGRGVFSSDGFVYTCGYVSSWNGYYDIMVIKWDTNGNVMWNQTWGGNQGDTGMDIWCDGSKVYITGYTSSYGAGQDDVVLIIYNVDGTFVSYNTFGGPDDDYGNCIWGDPQAIYIGGRTDVNSTQGDDILLLKLSKTGTLVFNRTWGGTGTDAAYGIWGDGSAIYVCGYTNSFGEGSCDAVITKWTGTGDFQWFKTWGGRSYEYGLGIWGDGANIYITGYTGSFGIGSSDAFIVTWTAGGTFVFYRTWGGLFYDEGNCIWGIGANIYISGYTNSFGTGRYALFLLKLGPDGILQLVKTCDGILNLWVYGIHGNQDSMYLCGSEYDGIRYNLFITRISLAGEFGIISPCYGEKTRQYQRITFQWSEANFTGDTITYTWQLSSSTLFTTAVYDIDTM